MAEEPRTLGERLRNLEREVAHLRGDMAHREAETSLATALLDDVILPMLLLLGAREKAALRTYLSGALGYLSTNEQVPELLREDMQEKVRGWLRAVDAIPDWRPLEFDERHPDR